MAAIFIRVVAITRGGLAPAMIIARELDIRVVDTISVKSYNHQTQADATVLKSPQAGIMGNDGEGVLIIDDLVDTGKTLELVRGCSQGAFRDRLRQAGRARHGRQLHHRSQPGHMDLLSRGTWRCNMSNPIAAPER